MVKQCEVCKKKFENVSRYVRKTCSKECNYELVADKTKQRGVEQEIRSCVVCDQSFSIKPWKKDKTCTKECKAKLISKNMLGKKKSEEHCKNISAALKASEKAKKTQFKKGQENPAYGRNQTGLANSNWKGGITNTNQKRRNDPKLIEWRKKVFERDCYTCQDCGAKGYLHAHHVVPFSEDYSKAFDVDNGKTLCVECHEKVHGRFIGKFKQSS